MDRRNLFCSLFIVGVFLLFLFVCFLRVCCCCCLAVFRCCLLFAVFPFAFFLCDSKNLFRLFTFRVCFAVVVVRLIGCYAAAFLLF